MPANYKDFSELEKKSVIIALIDLQLRVMTDTYLTKRSVMTIINEMIKELES